MEIRDLEIFMKVYEFSSITKAASHIGYTQSAVSSCIKRLEKELDCRLFDRLSRGIRPTKYADSLYTKADLLISEFSMLREEIKGSDDEMGSLNITCTESTYSHSMPQLIKEYRDRHPGIRVNLRMQSESAVEALTRMDSDIVITWNEGGVPSSVELLARNRTTFFLYEAADSTSPPVTSITDLEGRILIYGTDHSVYDRMLRDEFLKRGLDPKYAVSCDNTVCIAEMARNGVGLALLPAHVGEGFALQGFLKRIDVPGVDISLYSHTYGLKGRDISARMRSFLELMKERFPNAEFYV